MNARKTLAVWMALLAVLPVALLLLLGSVYGFTVAKPFYRFEYQKNDTLEVLDTDAETLDAMTDAVIGYLAGTRENLNLQGPIHGVSQEIFSQQAKVHMADVLTLYRLLRVALPLSAGAAAALLLGAVFTAPKRYRLHCLCKGMLFGLGAIILFFLLLVLYAARDFGAAFTQFHLLFFSNDLWLFDASDALIRMLPTGFFIDIAIGIALVFGILMLIVTALCVVGVCITGARLRHRRPSERPSADAIFSSMAIADDSAVPEQTRTLLEHAGMTEATDGLTPPPEKESSPSEERVPEPDVPVCEPGSGITSDTPSTQDAPKQQEPAVTTQSLRRRLEKL